MRNSIKIVVALCVFISLLSFEKNTNSNPIHEFTGLFDGMDYLPNFLLKWHNNFSFFLH